MIMKPRELRPAWRNQWALIILIPFLFLMAAGVSSVEPTDAQAADSREQSALHAAAESNPETTRTVMWWIAFGSVGLLLYRRYSWLFKVDANRLSSHHGIIARNQKSVRVKDLRSVELQQGIFQRLFNVGDLAFYTAGSADAEVLFHGVKGPADIRDDIQQLLDEGSEGG